MGGGGGGLHIPEQEAASPTTPSRGGEAPVTEVCQQRTESLESEIRLTAASEVSSQLEYSVIPKFCSSQIVVYKIPRAFEFLFLLFFFF